MDSIILEGQISNKVIAGARGDFSVGNFNTGIGQFKIKSQLLDQFEEGDYQVRVSVTNLSLNTYVVKRTGITITEIVAEIDAIDVIDADVKPIDAESIEPDASVPDTQDVPVVQAQSKADSAKAVVKTEPQSPAKPEKAAKGKIVLSNKKAKPDSTDDEKPLDPPELFGYLWPLADTLQLDKTAPRPLIIQQKQYLVKVGYKFDARTQTWSK
jgi:hypothetical protein